MLSELLILILVIALVIIISSLPLYIAVKFLGGSASILKVFFTNIVVALVVAFLVNLWGIGSVIIVIVTILLYSFMFDLGFIKAFIAWLLQYVVAFVLFILAAIIFGLNIL